jgi:hypothetical protein
MKKKYFLIGLALLIMLFQPTITKAQVSEAVTYLQAQPQDAWITQGLVAAGVADAPIDHLTSVIESFNPASDYAKTILALAAVGKNPANFGNIDYVQKLKSYYDGNQMGDSALLNDDIWSILALASVFEANSDEAMAAKDFLLANQNSDGGWGYAVGGDSDTNDTAAAIMALVETGVSVADSVITNAVAYLQSLQNEDGGFPYNPIWGTESDSGSDAWVISAIYKIGQDPANWEKKGNNPVTHLESLQDTDGGFWWVETSDWNNKSMTPYAVIALSGKSFPVAYYQIPPTYHLIIRGSEDVICDTDMAGPTALDAVENAASICGYTYNIDETDWGPYLNQIGDDTAAGMTGWMYYINGQSLMVGADQYNLSEGDEVLWHYAEWGWENITLEAGGESEVAVNLSQLPISVTVPGTVTDATLNVGALTTDNGDSKTAVLPEITLNVTTGLSFTPVEVTIPADTVVAAPQDWDSIINIPRVELNSSVTVIPQDGNTADVSSVIEIGSNDTELIFNKAVRILIPEAAGRYIGYFRDGNFTEITAVCSGDTEEAGDALAAGGDCKIDAGSDLVIWTKHFTKFVSYTQAAIPDSVAPLSSSSGGSVITSPSYCQSVEYDKWQNVCVDNLEYRNILFRIPSSCTLTTEQNDQSKRACTTVNDLNNEEQEEESEEETPPEALEEVEVLGVEYIDEQELQLNQVVTDARSVASNKVENVLGNINATRNLAEEKTVVEKYTKPLIRGIDRLTASNTHAITNFIAYGTKNTEELGAGERAGVLNSYKSTFGKLPAIQGEWEDVIRVGANIFPNVTNSAAEDKAKKEFRKIFRRDADVENSSDKTAINTIAYGLRPDQRNLDSERVGIGVFTATYNYLPTSAFDWDIIRAIAYSGVEH